MRLTVLGSAASFAGPGEACAGYLVSGGGATVLLDCGNGVLANLQKVADPYALDAVFVTHHHIDHFADLYAMQSMLRYAPDGPRPPLRLHVPEGLFEAMGLILSERGAHEFAEAFEVEQLRPDVPVELAGMRVVPRLVDHTDPTFALVVEADGARLCYTSDTSLGERALEAARGADLLLAEATLPEQYEGAAPHLTSGQAGRLAREADAGELVLTHIWPTNDRTEAERAARSAFSGTITVAHELDVFEVQRKDQA